MIRKLLLSIACMMTLTAGAQETLLPDTALSLPPLNSLGQMHYINRWPMSYSLTGYHDWDLHSGLNVSLGASVFTGFGKHAPGGAGFAQDVSGMYAVPFNDKLSLAFGGYFLNANWGGMNLRDAGLSAVLGYRFNERWEGYVYGQKSLIRPKTAWPYCWGMNELGDRIGAAIKYNFSPSFSIQVSVEEHKYSLHEK
jgi:hypothetical protein